MHSLGSPFDITLRESINICYRNRLGWFYKKPPLSQVCNKYIWHTNLLMLHGSFTRILITIAHQHSQQQTKYCMMIQLCVHNATTCKIIWKNLHNYEDILCMEYPCLQSLHHGSCEKQHIQNWISSDFLKWYCWINTIEVNIIMHIFFNRSAWYQA